MARSCGIRIGDGGFEVVVVEGSAKKPVIAKAITGEFARNSEDLIPEMVLAIREAIKDQDVSSENVALVVDTGLAAFRSVRLPFQDKNKIEEVIQFEVENQLPQWAIDDVIIDFHISSTTGVESTLLVTAIPKDDLSLRLSACEKLGLEPMEAELESSAIVNAAFVAGRLEEDSGCVLVHVGESSTSVVIMDGTKVHSMRAIHSGARMPLFKAPADGPTDPNALENEEGPAQGQPEELVDLDQVVARIRRELLRTVSAASTKHELKAIYVTGHDAPGLIGDEILLIPILPLNALPEGSPEVEHPERLTAAFGAAVRQMGGGMLTPSLRRGDLKHKGNFERLELPLAVAGLLLLTLLSVHFIVNDKKLKVAESDMNSWLVSTNNYMLGVPKKGWPGWLRKPNEELKEYARKAETVEEPTHYARFEEIRRKLNLEILSMQRQLGQDIQDDQPMSALDGATLVLGTIAEMGEDLGRFSIRSISSDYAGARNRDGEHIRVKIDMSFFAQDDLVATRHYENLTAAFRNAPWFIDITAKGTKVLETGEGVYIDGLTLEVNPKLAKEAL